MLTKLELKIPPPILILAAVLAMGAPAYWDVAPLPVATAWRVGVAAVLAAAGLGVLVACARRFTALKTTWRPERPEKATTLVTGGIYRFTRNPMYLSWTLVVLALAILFGDALCLAVPLLFAAYLTRFQIIPEERALERLFGEEYRRYRQRVRRWL